MLNLQVHADCEVKKGNVRNVLKEYCSPKKARIQGERKETLRISHNLTLAQVDQPPYFASHHYYISPHYSPTICINSTRPSPFTFAHTANGICTLRRKCALSHCT